MKNLNQGIDAEKLNLGIGSQKLNLGIDVKKLNQGMTGPQLHAIRLKLGFTLAQMGRALGRKAVTYGINVSQMEGGGKPIPDDTARMAEALEILGKNIPEKWWKKDRVAKKAKKTKKTKPKPDEEIYATYADGEETP